MELVRGLHNLSQRHRGCVLTVGNYDGVHLGHQQIIGVLKGRAEQLRSTATVLVFEPSSKEFIDPDGAPARLTRWREKFLALAAQGVERLVTLHFDECMRAMTPQCFVESLLVERLGARHLVVGDDFRYGSNAGGTIDSLRVAGQAHGFGVEQIPPYVFEGMRVSSTAVRDRLAHSDFPGVSDDGTRGAWSADRPHVGLSHGELAIDASQTSAVGHIGGMGPWDRGAPASRRCQSRHAAHGERDRAFARSACVRFFG
jgi:FAD synthase